MAFGWRDPDIASRKIMPINQSAGSRSLAWRKYLNRCVFDGDSPMFAFFPHSVGVANVLHFKGRLAHPPAYITRAECGAGFVEVAQHLLAGR